jgi:hypothetical protein
MATKDSARQNQISVKVPFASNSYKLPHQPALQTRTRAVQGERGGERIRYRG